MKEIFITKENEGQRLDKYLLKYFNVAGKGFIYKMLRKKRIKLNGGRAQGNELLSLGDTINLYISPETMDLFMKEKKLTIIEGSIDIIFEDENILICNKPPGLLSHSSQPSESNPEDTMIDRMLAYLYENSVFSLDKNSIFTPAICNRLDRNTSGIVICGKNSAAVREINRIIANRRVEKLYFAIVCGKVNQGDLLKGYHSKDKNKNVSSIGLKVEDGKEVLTMYRPVQVWKNFTLVKIELITGRTHQIRVHLTSAGYPILGDEKYGNSKINREMGIHGQLLHAGEFTFKEKEGMLSYLYNRKFVAQYPPMFKKVLDDLQN